MNTPPFLGLIESFRKKNTIAPLHFRAVSQKLKKICQKTKKRRENSASFQFDVLRVLYLIHRSVNRRFPSVTTK